MSIQVLDKNVIDQIAAGEVVERPSHLVKELIENAIDAKATQIEVHFENSGRDIEIIDNGLGIEKSDLKLAIERHATSKIQQFDDIWNLRSFGFRGEALASISAVSDFEITSRHHQSKKAYKLRCLYGELGEVLETSNSQGTRIRIQNLFENVPVRLKFLKTQSYEHGLIKQVIKAMALSQSEIEFKVFENKKLISFYPKANNLLERVKSILQAKESFHFEYENDGYKVECVFSSPYQVERNTKNIWLFVQNRWVQDKVLVSSILESYQNLLMHGEYPQVVLKLTVPAEQVDVNIHPTKSQIKFLNSQVIYRLIYKSLRREIEQAPWKKVLNEQSPSPRFFSEQVVPYNAQSRSEATSEGALDETVQQSSLPDFDFSKTQYQQKDFHFKNKETFAVGTPISNFSPSVKSIDQTPWVQVKTFLWSGLQVIGQMNLTYIICQDSEKMVMVDQHAAHERVLFEKIKSQLQENAISVQNLLIPLSMDMESDQLDALLENAPQLKKLGVDFEQLGPNTLGIVSIPSFLKEASAVELLKKFSEEVKELGGSFAFEKKLNDLIATMACHSAIRAGQALSYPEMEKLLVEMDEYPLSSFCPHGRPVNVEIPFREIEKDFGRIV